MPRRPKLRLRLQHPAFRLSPNARQTALALIAACQWIGCSRKAAEPTSRATDTPRAESPLSASPARGPQSNLAKVSAPRDEDVDSVRFMVIGDYGVPTAAAAAVASLARAENPDFIITLGDNNYPDGAAATIDQNIGRHYHSFIHPYLGRFGASARENRFFPSLGNHDWNTPGARPYLDYFSLPGNERYYDFIRGDVHLFALDSDPNEPDGITADSSQAAWLKARLAASKTAFQVVYMHHPPYSSAAHGSAHDLRWPYATWGADLVLAGHDHVYERLEVHGIPYVVNGLGGHRPYPFRTPLPESRVRFNERHGAQIVEVTRERLVARFVDVNRKVVDEFVLTQSAAP